MWRAGGKDMPDARREFKAILEAIVVVVSWRRRQTRNLKLTPRPIKFPRVLHSLNILPKMGVQYSYNSDLCDDIPQMTDCAMPCLALADPLAMREAFDRILCVLRSPPVLWIHEYLFLDIIAL
jgi:hypothetical protein